MKLLFDENISYRIIRKIIHVFPDAEQVKRIGLLSKRDSLVWEYAKSNGFTIVTFNEDYTELSILRGVPPKVIWLRVGNTTTQQLADLFIQKQEVIQKFILNEEESCLELY